MSAKYFPQKFFTLLLFIVFMSGLIPAAEADLYVGNTQVTGTTSGTGWSYSATNHTLTLNGFNFNNNNAAYTDNNNVTAGIYYNGNDELTIELTGTNTITMSEVSNGNSYGIYITQALLNFSGNGSLTVTGGNATNGKSYGISCYTMNVRGGTIKATGKTAGNTSQSNCGSYGINCTGNMTFTGGTIEAIGGDASGSSSFSYGIYCQYDITVNGATVIVTAKGGNAISSYGICCSGQGDIKVTSGTVEAEGGEANNTCGIQCKSMTVSDGSINATGGKSTQDDSHGINCRNGTMTVSGGTVTATGGQGEVNSYGIECYNTSMALTGGIITATGGTTTNTSGASYGIDCNDNITVNGATVTATGGNAGIHCFNATITVTNGEVTATGTEDESYGIQCAEPAPASVRLSSTNDSLTINGGKLTAIGASQAIKSSSFSTSIAGTGWIDTAGTAGKAPIPAGTMNISSYKKIVFQAQQSSAPSNPGGGSGGGQSTTGYEVIDTDTKNNTQTTTTDVTVRGNLSGTNIVEVIQQIESTTEVKTLDLSNVTGVTEVKLPENTKIETLTITENTSIKKVEVSNNDSLKTINLSGSKIEEVNASECSGLETVEVENNTSLVTLNVSYSSVTILNAKNCVNLEILNCERCEIRDLNIEGCQKLWGLDCSYNNLTRLDVSGFSNLSSLACQGQIVRGFKRVQSFNLIDFLFRKTSEFFLADYTEEELKELDYVHNLKAFDESGNEIQVNSDEQGNLTFSKIPAKITYDYDTGFNNIVMDVTVETAEDESGEEDGSGKVSGSGGSGGGCNSNFGFAALAVLLKFCSRNSLRKSRKRT